MGKEIDQKSPKKAPSKAPEVLPLLLFPAKNKGEEIWLADLRKRKKIYKIGPRLYTSVAKSEVAKVVQKQWAHIVAQLFPEALLSHRSALEFKPTPEHQLILTGTTNRTVKYPGLTLHFIRGPKALDTDSPFLGFHASSQARAFLENLSVNKASAWRSLSNQELENKLETLLRTKGEEGLNALRDQARHVASVLQWKNEFEKLDQIVGALIGTRPMETLTSASARARAQGKPFDLDRVHRFDLLFSELRATPLKEMQDRFTTRDHFNNKAFFEAYFSNYIEGTTFEIDEAEEIVFDKKIPAGRPRDAHDVLSTFNIVSDPNELRRTPDSPEDLEQLIKNRHLIMLAERPEVRPGKYKDRPNRAGDTHFVHPDEIHGTFQKGYERYQDLPAGLARAIFIMFLISEVHPFTDGNGRIARILMNAELFSQGLSTIIIPTVYRDDYLSALRALTRRDRPDPLIRMLTRAHQFSHLEFSPYKKTLENLQRKNWFREPAEAKLIE